MGKRQDRALKWRFSEQLTNSPCSINASSKHSLSTHMTTKSKRIIVLLFFAALLAVVGLGCNTANGFGKDLEIGAVD